jgi:endo-1,4-beta-xylanase
MIQRFLFLLLSTVGSLMADGIPPGGRNVLPDDWPAAARFQGARERGTGVRAVFENGREGWRVAIADDQATPFQLQLLTPLAGEVKAGDKCLLTFEARCVPGSSSDGKGRVMTVVELHEPPDYEKLAQDTLDIGAEWQAVFMPFPAKLDSKPGLTRASFMLGGRRQTLEIANLRVLNYGAEFDLSKLPRPYLHYPGREPDAAWRKEALARIGRIRMAEVGVEVVDAQGKPVPGAKVSVALQRHAFAFGAAVTAQLLHADERYRRQVEEQFSAIVLENDLKPFALAKHEANDHTEYRRGWTLSAMSWAKQRGMRVRGHYLCWGPWEEWSETLKGEPAAIRAKVFAHTSAVLQLAGGLVDEWDAVNHPVGWESPRRTVDQVIGPDFYAEVFKRAREQTGAPLWTNEDQVFREGRQQEEFYAFIKDLIARGAAPDGIGNQAHFHSSHLPGGEEMLRVSDRFAALVPNLEITEFDVDTNGDEQLQADWLRDCLIMAYSHPAYSGFILWVFWEGAGWKPETALWRKDWSAKPNGKVWQDLVRGAWLTRAGGSTDDRGTWTTRGHRGLYEVTVEHSGKTTRHAWSTEKGAGMLRVVLP